MRRSMTSFAVSIAWSSAVSLPELAGDRIIRLPLLTPIFQSRVPVVLLISGNITSRAASTLETSVTLKLSSPLERDTSAIAICGSARRIAVRTLSSNASSRASASCEVSASSKMWLPPARSRPRLMVGVGTNCASCARICVGNRLGIANAIPTISTMLSIQTRQRGKSSIDWVRTNYEGNIWGERRNHSTPTINHSRLWRCATGRWRWST